MSSSEHFYIAGSILKPQRCTDKNLTMTLVESKRSSFTKHSSPANHAFGYIIVLSNNSTSAGRIVRTDHVRTRILLFFPRDLRGCVITY